MARKNYTPAFKARIVLEVLKEIKTVDQIASENNLNPNMVRTWRKEFLNNASSVFEDSKKVEKEYRQKEVALEKKSEKMLKKIGQLTIERDFLQDCFRENGLPIPSLVVNEKE